MLVVGSINMDVVARATRYPERGETIRGESVGFHPGGKGANQAVAAARLGAESVLVGCVGDDAFGADILAFASSSGVNVSRVRRTDVPTGTALIVVDSTGENTIVVVLGANGSLTTRDATGIDVSRGDVLLCQLETPRETVEAALAHARANGALAVLNAAPVRPYAAEVAALADIVVVNERELETLGRHPRRDGQALVATLGPRGAIAHTDHGTIEVPGRSVKAVDTTGAGDCFVGALGASLAAGQDLGAALRFANAAASLCVQREGAGPSMPMLDEVSRLD